MLTLILIDIFLVVLFVAADLLSKHYVTAFLLKKGQDCTIIDHFLSFTYSENEGAAFGLFSNNRWFLSVFVGVIVLGLIVFMFWHFVSGKYKDRGSLLLHISLSMIISGGIGNVFDRVAFGYVRDFIDYTFVFELTGKHFAICNVADVFLTIGVLLLVIYLFVFYINSTNNSSRKKNHKHNDMSNDEKNGSNDSLECHND